MAVSHFRPSQAIQAEGLENRRKSRFQAFGQAFQAVRALGVAQVRAGMGRNSLDCPGLGQDATAQQGYGA